MFEDIKFGEGISRRYEGCFIDGKLPLKMQVELLKEDLFQIVYRNNYIIDVGWYPEFSENGNFRIMLVKDGDWVNTILDNTCNDLKILEEFMEEYVAIVQKNIL